MIVSFLNQKGGVGKTTLSINIARSLDLNNNKVLLIDSDPQRSARIWHEQSQGHILNIIGIDSPTIDKDILLFKNNYDWILIDGAPQLSNMAIKIIKCSDIVIIPIQPSGLDFQASQAIIDLVQDRMIIDENLKAFFLISRQKAGTLVGTEFREILKQYDIPIFDHKTYDRTIYATSTLVGKTVFDFSDKVADAAKNEINEITDELIERSAK